MTATYRFNGKISVKAELRDGTIKELQEEDGLPGLVINSYSAFSDLCLWHQEYWHGEKPEWQLRKITIELEDEGAWEYE